MIVMRAPALCIPIEVGSLYVASNDELPIDMVG